MMKLFTVLFFFISFISWTQEDHALVLYRGIENRVYLKELSENERVIVNDSSILVKQLNDSIYLTIPALFPLNTLRLQVVDQHTNAMKMEQEIPVVFIPDPIVELYTPRGSCGGNTSIISKTEITKNGSIYFEVISYSFSFNDIDCGGYGNVFSAECIGLISQVYLDDIFLISAKVKGPDGIIREVKSQYKLE